MRVVEKPSQLPGLLAEAQNEALNAFGNPAVFLERYISRAKHIEVQILGDQHGNVVHLHERDCSVQRRYQKVVEVAPAMHLDPKVRKELCEAAVKLAAGIGYNNAGTVEFLYDMDQNDWFFIEMNPRIQVEHTVTECVTGIDLVRSQILIAQGNPLFGEEVAIPAAGQDPLQRLRHPVPRHHRGSGKEFLARLRPHPQLPLRRRLRHPSRRRLGRCRLGRHALL